MRSIWLASTLTIGLSVLAAPAARAGPVRELGRPDPLIGASADVAPRATTRVLTIGQADLTAHFENDRGEMSRLRTWNSVEYERTLDARWSARLDAEFEVDIYDLRHSHRILPGSGRLLEVGLRTRLEPGVDWRIGRDWMIGGNLGFETTSVPGAGLADASALGGDLYVWHRFSPSLALRFGLSVLSYLDADPILVPFVAPDDIDAASQSPWRLEVRGTGGHLGYAFTPTLTAGFAGAYDRRDWRLSSDDRAPNGLARDIRVTLGLFADVSPRPGLTFGIEVGMNVYQEFEVEDRNGDSLALVEASPSAYIGCSLGWRF